MNFLRDVVYHGSRGLREFRSVRLYTVRTLSNRHYDLSHKFLELFQHPFAAEAGALPMTIRTGAENTRRCNISETNQSGRKAF